MLFVNKLKVLTLMTCLVLVGQGFAGNCAADYVPPENPVWDGSTKTEPCMKDGFYIIDNAAKLAWYAAKGSDNKWNWSRGKAKLTADIDLGKHLWIPIAAGDGDNRYTNVFDGGGHVIRNLYINGTELATIKKNYAQNLGFIAVLAGGSVKNLILEQVNIQASTNAGDILGKKEQQISVGTVVGWMDEKATNKVEDCISSGTIRTTGSGQGVGGIVGNAKNGNISNCMSLVEIRTSGSQAYIGGIVGITKSNVTVSSCVYAGPGLINTGTDGAVGGVVGNVFSGTANADSCYFEGNGLSAVGASCLGNTKDDGTCKVDNITINDETSFNESDVNTEDIACTLNGINENGSCKEKPWSTGQSDLSLNGYGADGYKIVFDANGGVFANGKTYKNKFLDGGMAITADEVENPSRDNFSFAGWAKTRDAAVPAPNLGTVSKTDSVFAVWKPVRTITFNVAPGVFPETRKDENTKDVAEGDVITVEGLGALPESYCHEFDNNNQCVTMKYFSGWALDSGANFPDTLDLKTVAVTEGLKLYAVWDPVETYTVTYNANRHGKTTVDYVRVGIGELVDEPTPPIADEGYAFAGWFTDQTCEQNYTFKETISSSIVLYAKWTPVPYTISYEMNEVSSQGANRNSYNIETETFTLDSPADVEGYEFEGWYYDVAFTNKATQVIQGTIGDKTFYAKWTKKKYKISYLATNDAYGAASDQFKEHGTPITLLSSGFFTFAGFEQAGWTTTPGGETSDFGLGAIYEGDHPLTLYPVKGGNATYTITYECGEGCVNNPQNKTTYTINDQFGVKSEKVSRVGYEGYKFGGWYVDQAYSTRVTQIKKGTFGNKILYGKWNEIYTITYNGTDQPNNALTYTVDDKVTLGEPGDNVGYTFGGWYTNANFTGDVVTEIPLGSTGDKTFFAKWIPNTYTATYNLNGGSMEGEESFTFTIESGDVALATPTKNGYTFVGWLDDVTSAVVTVLSTGSFGDRTLTAQWSDPIEYTITYENVNGAANENATSYTIEQSVVLNNLEKDGFIFVGWFDNAQFEGDAATEIPQGSTGDKTFYAKWLEIFTITYAPGDDEGVTGEVASGTKMEGESATLSNDGFARNGYTQTGWKTADASATFDMGGSYTTDASVTLYPVWNVETYNIVYHNVEGATFETENPTTYTVETLPITLNNPTKVGFNFLGWFLSEDAEEPKAGIAAGSTGEANFYARWELAPSPITVTASSGTFEYDGETHNATCSYEGTLPVGYSIEMVPNGSVRNVSAEPVTTSCDVTITDESGDDVTDLFTELTIVNGTISVVAKTVNYGGVAIITDETGTRAEIDDDAKQQIDIPTDVTVEHVTFNRKFPLVKYATVVLPFSIDTNKVHGAEFYSIVMMKKEGKWVAGASQVKTTQLVANTPYLIFAKEANLTFDGSVTFNTSEIHDSTTTYEEDGCKWTFKGTYEKLVWGAGHPDLGKIYAFSAHDVSDEIKVGKFVKFGAESWIRPMRAYLVYEQLPSSDPEPDHAPAPMLAKSFNSTPSTASVEDSDVPEWIDVVIIGEEDEQTTPIARLNSQTGEIRMMDGWFDMKGRKLNGKPTAKGIYYNNGKRVIVK